MNFRQKLTLNFLLYIALSSAAFAQAVDIPDPNLRAAIAAELNIARDAPITKEHMLRLEDLSAASQGITDLTGLEYAADLQSLNLWGNSFDDLTPIAHLPQLSYLNIAGCSIIDITALSNLINLTVLNVRYNFIVDISPLTHLTNLVELRLNDNKITDISPLDGLTKLQFLEIQHNQITDHSPLDTLALSHFIYDQTCEMPPLPLEPRLENRNYPSIFARWSGFGGTPVTNRPNLSEAENLALHDLRFAVHPFGLKFLNVRDGFKMTGDVDRAISLRDEVLAANPNIITLVDVRLRGEGLHILGEDCHIG